MSKFMDRTTTVDQAAVNSQKVSMRGVSAVKQILVFTGSKGGVGRTTILVNLAKTLSLKNYSVGIIDTTGSAEIALAATPINESISQKPSQRSGISIVSFYHLKQSQLKPPFSTSTLKDKLLEVCDQTAWGSLDFLLIDIPSGNMDLALFVGGLFPASQFLLVTTPAAAALVELRQDIRLLQTHHIKPFGIIENMSFFMCGHSGDPLELIGIFSAGGGQRISQESALPLLATIPIHPDISAAFEAEKTLYEHTPASEAIDYYQDLASQLLKTLHGT